MFHGNGNKKDNHYGVVGDNDGVRIFEKYVGETYNDTDENWKFRLVSREIN